MNGVEPVTVVGVPPTGLGALDARGREALARATLLCGARRHLDATVDHGEERVVIGDVSACVDRLRRRGPGDHAVVLATGDPLCYGIGATLVRELGCDSVRVVPAVSSLQEAFARARIAWHDARILSAHGRELAPVVRGVLGARVAAVLCGPNTPPQLVAAALLAGGVGDCRAVVAERLCEDAEHVVDARLSAVAAGEFDDRSVLVVERVDAAPAAGFGRPESVFSHARGMITRAEVRVVGLSMLRPGGATVIWDVGAGSGSIGIEAATLAPAATVFAVERDVEQLVHLRANAAALGGGRVRVVEGTAPAALADLPDPDRVAIGGHGGRLLDIIDVIRSRLRPHGRLVCYFATLDGAVAARRALLDWSPEVVQVSVARGVAAGAAVRLRAEDPVVIVAAEAPA